MTLDLNINVTNKYNSNAISGFASALKAAFSNGTQTMPLSPDLGHELPPYRDQNSLRKFIMIAPHPIVVTGADGVVRFCNSFAAELFGYSEEEMTGLEFASLVCLTNNGEAVSSDNTDAEDNALVPDTHLATETTAHRKNSEVLPVELGSSEFELDAEKIIIHFIRDISFRKRSKQRIMELQRELMHLSRQNVLGELASAITHELNQPLTAITNYATAARRCGCTASPESLEASFALMEKAECQAQRARQIVHKLRSLVAHHEVECAEHDLRTVLEEAVQLASLGAAEYGIDVSLTMPSMPVKVYMDRVPVQILLTNLVRNAVDALNTWTGDKKVTIILRLLPDNSAEVSVQDTGAGIATEVFETIFDPFHSTKPEGLGMGLAICRRIAEAHDGLLNAANLPEGGAIFSFIVPMSNSK
ncbi:MAG: PAS domain-containing sensor histidine kinase [Alphaproteobacteria bacterium]